LCLIVDLISQLHIGSRCTSSGNIQFVACPWKVIPLEEHTRKPVARARARGPIWVLDNQTLEVPLRSHAITSHHLELGKPNEGILRAR
jgi:hypothetical protein